MIYGSVCSGIESATVAWHPLGWRPAFFAEIASFPSAVLKHYYPAVPNHGDFTKIQSGDYAAIDLLVGGTPCQDFSVAGLRAGVAGERGNLTLEFLRLAQRLRPRWLVWENVPGVYSSTSNDAPDHGHDGDGRWEDDANESHAFACFLAGLQELGYGFAYRTLDAQHFGVPQRRRRVFVVGHLGDWRRAAAVLFERHSLSGDTPPRREKGQGVTYDVAPCLGASGRGFERTGDTPGQDCLIASTGDISHCLNAGGMGRQDFETETLLAVGGFPDTAHALRADGFDASEDGTGRGTPLVPVAFSCKDHGADAGEMAPTLRSLGAYDANAGSHLAVAMNLRGRDGGAMPEMSDVASLRAASGGSSRSYVAGSMAVRRLTPRECERLQGFPDDYTLVPYRGKPAADGPRYKALGNSKAVPVVRWIGERIAMVDALPPGA